MFYEKLGEGRVRCTLSPKVCLIKDGGKGFCRVRENSKGTLYTVNYAEVAAEALDPTEKKPLYHFYPGSTLLSLGTVGCNLGCGFCQNWSISQGTVPTRRVMPDEVVAWAKGAEDMKCIGIAYTYSEPTIWYEFVYDTAKLAASRGLKNVLVTNGFINDAPLRSILPLIHAMNIDVKSFRDEFYKRVCAGRLEPVLHTVEAAYNSGCHVEVTNLLIPGHNDSDQEIGELVDWLSSISHDIPLHFSRYFPQHKFTVPQTPVETLVRAREIALRKLRYVYIGNVWGTDGSHTFCYNCGKPVIARIGYRVSPVGMSGTRCKYCETPIAISGRLMC